MLRVRLWDEREGKEDTGKQSRSPHQELLGIQTIRLSLLRTGTGVGVGVSGGGVCGGQTTQGSVLYFLETESCYAPLASPDLRDPLASATRVLRLKVCANTPSLERLFSGSSLDDFLL